MGLRQRRESLSDFVNDLPDWLMGRLLHEGITDPEEARRRLYAADEERQLIERQLEALDVVRRLREMARMPV